MRPIDRDLIRGGHYGQRSCEPHSKAEHMAAPTNAALVKKVLANSEPSTHGPSRMLVRCSRMSVLGEQRKSRECGQRSDLDVAAVRQSARVVVDRWLAAKR